MSAPVAASLWHVQRQKLKTVSRGWLGLVASGESARQGERSGTHPKSPTIVARTEIPYNLVATATSAPSQPSAEHRVRRGKDYPESNRSSPKHRSDDDLMTTSAADPTSVRCCRCPATCSQPQHTYLLQESRARRAASPSFLVSSALLHHHLAQPRRRSRRDRRKHALCTKLGFIVAVNLQSYQNHNNISTILISYQVFHEFAQ